MFGIGLVVLGLVVFRWGCKTERPIADVGFAARLITGSLVVVAVYGCDEAVVGQQSYASLERDVELRGGISEATAYAVARVVRHAGWPCESVAKLRCAKKEYEPRIHTVVWVLNCNAGADLYRVIEQRRGESVVFKVEARSPMTVRVAGRTGPMPNTSAGACPATSTATSTPPRRLGITAEELRRHHGHSISHWTDQELADAAYEHYSTLYDREEFDRLFFQRAETTDIGNAKTMTELPKERSTSRRGL